MCLNPFHFDDLESAIAHANRRADATEQPYYVVVYPDAELGPEYGVLDDVGVYFEMPRQECIVYCTECRD